MAEKGKTEFEVQLKRLLQKPDVRKLLESQGVNLEEAEKQLRVRTERPEGLDRRIQAAMSTATLLWTAVSRTTGKEE